MATKKKTATPKKTVAKKTVVTNTRKSTSAKASEKTPKKKVPSNTASAKTVAKTKPKETLKVKGKNPKEVATAKGEPYVSILSVELDPDNIGNGAFELDWNDKFVANLVRAGYQTKANESDSDIVDRWFQEVCKNIAQENFEQWEANQPYAERPRVINRRDLGDGKTEVS
jgi:hypothetical protein